MLTVTVKELEDYWRCPLLYEKKYVLLEKPERLRSSSYFDGHSHIMEEAEKAIQKLTGFYFHRLMDNRQVRYETLYHKWERTWWNGISGTEIRECIVPVERASRVRVNTGVVSHLPSFHKTFHKPFIPVAVGKKIELPIEGSVLSSGVEMAYQNKSGLVRIVKFLPRKIAPGDPKTDLDLVVQGCAWMNLFDEPTVEVSYYCMMSPKKYEPFTVAKLDNKSVPELKRILTAFQNRETIGKIECSGCEYRC
jgi:hypothetical protein